MAKQLARAGVRSRWVLRVVVALVSVLCGTGLGELIVRVAGLAPPVREIVLSGDETAFRYSDNPLLGYELKPNFRAERYDGAAFPYINAHGFRDKERVYRKPDGVFRVAVLGDSVVVGDGLQDLNDTMSRQLETMYGDRRVEVLNMGVPGYCTLAELELLRTRGLRYQPDVVVLVFVQNDYLNFNLQFAEATHERPRWSEILFHRSHLFRVLALRHDLFRFREQYAEANTLLTAFDTGALPKVVGEWRSASQLDAPSPGQANARALPRHNVEEGLVLFKRLAGIHGFQPIVGIWPAFLDAGIIDEDGFWAGRPPGTQGVGQAGGVLRVERLLADLEIDSFRFSRHFPITAGENPRVLYTIGDGLHPSRHGNQIAARALRRELERFLHPPR